MQYINLEKFLKINEITVAEIEKIATELFKEELSGIAVVGSISLGHGTNMSDLDISVITKYEDIKNIESRNIFYKDIRVDFEFTSLGTLNKFTECISKLDFEKESHNFAAYDFFESIDTKKVLDFFGRFFNGYLLKEPTLSRDKSIIKHLVNLYYSNIFRIAAENIYEDIVGLYEANDFISSYLTSLDGVLTSIVSMFLKHDIYIDRKKWAFYHIKKTNHPIKKEFLQIVNGVTAKNYQQKTDLALELIDKILNE